MVLRHFLAVSALIAAGCVTARPVVRAPKSTAVATAFVRDSDESRDVTPVPDAVADKIREALEQRNLKDSPVPAATWTQDFAARRTTQFRLQTLAAASQAELVMLVETKASFYSLLNGRFRWTVHAKSTMAKREALADAVSTESDFPVFLDFDFQRESEALAAAAGTIADDAGRLADQFLSGTLTAGPSPHASVQTPSKIGPGDSIYFVMVDRFSNGDRSNDGDVDPNDPQAFHGGDLQGVLNKLDYIQDLGFTTVWLSPVFQMRTAKLEGHGAFHGYWVEDMSRVEPRFGDEALLKKLSDELHRRGMKLVLDVVLNHVAYDAPLVRQHPDWFHHNGDIKDWNDRKQLENNDVHGLPDLAQETEEVYQYLLANSIRWIDAVHPDGFRLDAVKHVPLSFWARYNEDIRKHAGADFFLLGEDLEGDPDKLADTLREGRFTSLFNFPLYFATIDVFCKGKHPGRLGAVLEAEGARRTPLPYVNLVDNHDLPRLMTACGGDVQRARRALDFMLVVSGTPSVGYGTELALAGAGEPGNRSDMRFGEVGLLQNNIQAGLSFRRHAPVNSALAFTLLGPTALAFVQVDGNVGLFVGLNIGTTAATAALPEELIAARPRSQWPIILFRDGANDPRPVVTSFELEPGMIVTESLAFGAVPEVDVSQAGRLTFRTTGEGELALVGLGRDLGSWSPKNGIAFRPQHGALEATVLLAPGGIYQFKLVARQHDGSYRWEDREDRFLLNRGGYVDVSWNASTTPNAG